MLVESSGAQRIETGRLRANCYLVFAPGGDGVVIDPGDQPEAIEAVIAARGISVRAVLCTHAHFDHVAAAAALCEMHGAPFHMHRDDSPLLRRASFIRTVLDQGGPFPVPRLDVPIVDGMALSFGALKAKVIHTPGHTPGSVCFEMGGELFTGDTVGPEGLGPTDLPGADRETLLASFDRLVRDHPPDTVVHPGHGTPILLGDVCSRRQ